MKLLIFLFIADAVANYKYNMPTDVIATVPITSRRFTIHLFMICKSDQITIVVIYIPGSKTMFIFTN